MDVHFTPSKMPPYLKNHGRYRYDELEEIFENTDVLVVPSVWYETFGYTVLEAISYGVPVIMSGTVGARDILADGGGIIIEDITPDKLFHTLLGLTEERLREMNQMIVEKQTIMTIKEMAGEIERSCYRQERCL